MEDNTVEVQVDDGSASYTEDVLFDGWDDDVTMPQEETADEETVEADQPAESEAQPEEAPVVPEEAPKEEEPAIETPKPVETDQFLTLKHLDETRTVTKDEAVTLAQKGMDYDRVRGKLDDANNQLASLKEEHEFLEEIRGEFPDIKSLMADTRARLMSEKENISFDDALAKVRESMANKPAPEPEKPQPEVKTPTREDLREMMRKESITEFVEQNPTIKAEQIPQEVWDDFQKTNNLSLSYERYQNKKLKADYEALIQNKKNEEKAVGSLKTSGSAKTIDKYLEGWDDDF